MLLTILTTTKIYSKTVHSHWGYTPRLIRQREYIFLHICLIDMFNILCFNMYLLLIVLFF